jgi:nitric oxide reductase activation protein
MDGGKPSSDDSKSQSSVQLSDRQKDLLKKKIEKQKKFLDGDIQKTSISKADSKNLNAIEQSGSELKEVGKEFNSGYYGNQSVQCIVVKKLTKSLWESEMFPMTYTNYWIDEKNPQPVRMYYQEDVDKGIKLGTMLGKKLQVRGEDRTTVFNRQKVGRIDKRMISSLGFGNENVFQFTEVDSYKKANLHISVDASSSMGGDKWKKTMVNVVAICKAVDMIPNLQVQVTFRCTQDNKPYVVMAYDSRVDKFSKVKSMFPALGPNGTTPEGLCFEAIQKEFVPINNDLDSYFLNLSDGQPYFGGPGFYYSGDSAERHTNKMVKMIEGMGIQTLAYFIGDSGYSTSHDERSFKNMYGKGAKMIDVENVNQITKTMNQLFLQK